MNNVIGSSFEELVEQGVRSAARNVKQQAGNFAKSAKGQIAGQSSSPQNDQGTNEQGNSSAQQMSDDQAKQFLRDLYGVKKDNSSPKNPKPEPHPIQDALGIPQKDPNAGKTPEEIAKMQTLRSQLHQDYYQKLVNPPKPKEEPVAEKLEREQQMEDLEVQKKEKEKPGPLANQKTGTGERMIGVSG